MLVICVFISLLTYWIIVHYKKYRELNEKLKNFPGTNSTYPILGDINMWSITKWSIHDKTNHFIELLRNYPTTLKVWFGPKVAVVINNPEDIKTILASPHCTDKASVYRLSIGGVGLFVANGNKWKNQRRHLNTTFSICVLNSYTKELNQFGRNIVAGVKGHTLSGKQLDITPTLGIYVVDLITRTIYGNTQHKLEYSKRCYELVERLMYVWGQRMYQIYFHILLVLLHKIFRIPSEDKKLTSELRTQLEPIFNEVGEEFKSNQKGSVNNAITLKGVNFLKRLNQLRDEGVFCISEYRHTCMAMFLAGTETTTRSLSIIILMLAIHEEYQQTIFEEICNVFDVQDSNDIDISKLSELNLLDRFIKETFRLFPVVPFLARKPSRDIPLKEGILPGGTDIIISVVNIHQHPDVWGKDARKFNPDNFLPEAEANRNKCSYLPFSYGPRNCIGFKFAQFATYIGIVYLLKNYQFKTTLKMEDIKFGHGITTYLLNDNVVSVQSRNVTHKYLD